MRINYVRSESQDDNFHIFRLLLLVLTVFGLLPIAFLVCLSTEIIRTISLGSFFFHWKIIVMLDSLIIFLSPPSMETRR